MTYTTVQGDMWDTIAYKVYGNEQSLTLLMRANPEHLRTVIFDAGIQLAVHALPPDMNADLPPWKRGAL